MLKTRKQKRAQKTLDRPILHRWDGKGALCGAPVIGVLVRDQPLECVVCADLARRQ